MLFLLGLIFTLCAGAAGALYIIRSRKKPIPSPSKSEPVLNQPEAEPKPQTRNLEAETSLQADEKNIDSVKASTISTEPDKKLETSTDHEEAAPKLTRSASNSSQSSEVKSSGSRKKKKSKKQRTGKSGEIDTDVRGTVTNNDLRRLFGKKHTFFSGEKLVMQSEVSPVVLVLYKGKAQINRNPKVQEQIQPLCILGDRSLFQLPSLHSVFAEDDVQCYSCPAAQLLEKLKENPYSAVRFFRSLASQLSQELMKKNDEGSAFVLKKRKSLLRRGTESPEQILEKKFSLKDVEVLSSSNVMYIMGGKSRGGKLILTPMGLFFYSKIFGMTFKDTISTGAIVSLDSQKRDEYKLVHNSSGREKTVTLTPLYKKDKADFEDLMERISVMRAEAEQDSSPRVVNLRHMQSEMSMTDEDWENILTEDPTNFQRDVKEGETVFERGQEDRSLYQVLRGSCRIMVDQKEVAVLGAGETFGEFQFLTSHPATATVIGAAETTLVEISSERINDVVFPEHPQTVIRFYHHLCGIAQKRLSPS